MQRPEYVETFLAGHGLVCEREIAMDQTHSAAELRIRIAKYRAMARLTTDQETARRIHELVNELEAQLAAKLHGIEAEPARSPRGPELGR